MNIQGNEFVVDLYVLEIKGCEVVLGVQWLIELGTIKSNYQDLTMEFNFQNRTVKLQGDNILISDPFRGRKLSKLAAIEGILSCISCILLLNMSRRVRLKGRYQK